MFPKKSAFGQREDAMNQATGIAPEFPHTASGAEDSRRPGGQALTKIASVHVATLENWIQSLELAENDGDVLDVVEQMRQYLPG